MVRRIALYLLLILLLGTGPWREQFRAKLEEALMQRLAPVTIHELGGYQVVIRGYPQRGQLDLLNSAFREMPPAMVEDIEEIIFQPPQHFNDWTNAHAEGIRNVICLRAEQISMPSTIWHEAAHIRTYELGNDFAGRWRTVATPVYGKYSGLVRLAGGGYATQWLEGGGSGPRHGCLSPYGATEYMEDIAVFTQEVYSLINYYYSNLMLVAFSDDSRYRQKVDLLLEGGFITADQHAQVKAILGWD